MSVKSYLIIFLSNILIIGSGFNLDSINPIIAKHKDSSYFGYSILLYSPWMIVGAPKANYTTIPNNLRLPKEPGLAYRCHLETGKCEEFRPSDINDVYGYIDQVEYSSVIKKEYGWFGAAMTLQETSKIITICAPRTRLSIFRVIGNTHLSMHGVCYSGEINSESLQMDDVNLTSHDFLTPYWYNPLHGFSVHYPSSSSFYTTGEGRQLIGSPGHELDGSVRIKDQSSPVMLSSSIIGDLAQLGYAVSSGRFFNSEQLLYVGSAPGVSFTGQVVIIDPSTDPGTIVSKISGHTLGEYFGGSLAVGDMNNDGLDDLIVGAPHWGNDNGRIYIFFGNSRGFFEADIVISGEYDDSCFGYSITCGDLDSDGFDDVIIGAPWEGNGAIYILNGDSRALLSGDTKLHKIQVSPSVKTFGFSLAKPTDIDGNGYPDVGVGAYKSSHAVIFKSRPVVNTSLQVFTLPRSLRTDSASFLVKICVGHVKKGLPVVESFNLTVNIDGRLKRTLNSQLLLNYIANGSTTGETSVCLNRTVLLMRNIPNYVDPIEIVVTHNLKNQVLDSEGIVECDLCPIDKKGALTKSLDLFFDIGCGMDEVCVAILGVSANFTGAKKTWIIGSEDLSLEINIWNNGEPAYSTTVIVELPRDVSVRSLLSICQEDSDADAEISRITCNVDNPLIAAENPKVIILDLDMSRLNNGSANGTMLNFNVIPRTRSVNNGTKIISANLLLLSDHSIAVNGQTNDGNYDYDDDLTSNISFQHSYQILKSGATPITEAQLNVLVPVQLGNLQFIVLTNKPAIFVSGKLCKCSITQIPLSTEQKIVESSISKDESAKGFHLDVDKNHTRFERHIAVLSKKFVTSSLSSSKSDIYITKINRIYLNCSMENVKCGKITCLVESLKSDEDTGGLQLKFSINPTIFVDENNSTDSEQVIEFITEAWIDGVKPGLSDTTIQSSKLTTKVSTSFHKFRKLKRISIWIVIGSVLIGLVLFFLIAILLWLMGFFKRNKKTEMEALKCNDPSISDEKSQQCQ